MNSWVLMFSASFCIMHNQQSTRVITMKCISNRGENDDARLGISHTELTDRQEITGMKKKKMAFGVFVVGLLTAVGLDGLAAGADV